MTRNLFFLILLALAGLAAGCGAGAQPPAVAADTPSTPPQQLPFAEGKTLVVPANTAIYVRLQQSISSATAQSGQNFSAELDEPLVVEGQTLAEWLSDRSDLTGGQAGQSRDFKGLHS